MVDVQPKGLLLQLTDVLYALTESHHRLVVKLQSVRLEHGDPTLWSTDLGTATDGTFVSMEPATQLLPSAEVVTVAPTAGASPQERIDHEDFRLTQQSDEPFAVDDSLYAVATFPNAANNEQTAGGVQEPAIPAQSSAMTSTTPTISSDPGEGTASRNYNFFDELDARLTHLKDS